VLWDRGNAGQLMAVPLDPPGSTDAISTAYGINNRGEIAGASGTTSLHSWIWTARAGRISLGALPGDVGSIPQWINNRGQVVGASCVDTPLCVLGPGVQLRAYLWQDGVMVDLNDLITHDSHLYLGVALAINDRGQITGIGVTDEGEPHAFLATPTHGQAYRQASPGADASRVMLPSGGRQSVRGLGGRGS
jgi:probable HAF family extracellular repeat protein